MKNEKMKKKKKKKEQNKTKQDYQCYREIIVY